MRFAPALFFAAAAALAGCVGPVAAGRARVAIHCSDEQAELTVDGVPHGLAQDYAAGPHWLLLAPGTHVLVLRGHGEVETRSLSVGPKDDLTLTIALGKSARAAAQGGLQ